MLVFTWTDIWGHHMPLHIKQFDSYMRIILFYMNPRYSSIDFQKNQAENFNGKNPKMGV